MAWTKLATAGKKTVFLSEGGYPESVTFDPSHSGIVVEGGWTRPDSTWRPDCAVNAQIRTVIASPTAVGVTVGAVTSPSGLRMLTVKTKAVGAKVNDTAGESLYGVVLLGTGVRFSLTDVDVTAGRAGDGGAATAVGPQIAGDCSDLANRCGDGLSWSGRNTRGLQDVE